MSFKKGVDPIDFPSLFQRGKRVYSSWMEERRERKALFEELAKKPIQKTDRFIKKDPRLLLHRNVQNFLRESFPEGEIFLEHPFPKHIADAVWLKEKIVFEVQCSPISLEEAKRRNRDYNLLGFKVVWILHQKNFNRFLVSKAEQYLREGMAYFTNMTLAGDGYIYDQFDFLKKSKRVFRSFPLTVDLTSPTTKGFVRDRHDQPREILDLMKKKGAYFETTLFERSLFKYKQWLMLRLRKHSLKDF